ncbi:nucleotidyltransferase family protein [Arenibacter sp. GZD96]|uniref:nucleotidyltransferase family protein n=1 Tax=Aurantibrevibacter litoralis TaxID=3106030 RepID=UPI002AFF5D8C|nr:nucleotidyltransferase family protein [Arenibacter sp. GZD-96]MEA1785348.1 nucleotidyltransferase family protein [Arenibacter sp. GZD-96]
MKKFVILILAAGNSSRMGSVKQLLPWKNGTLLENAIQQATASHANEVIVILGAHAEKIKKNKPIHGVKYLENKNWASGLGTSIAFGVQYIQNHPNKPKGVLLMLADQPLVNTAFLNEMMLRFEEAPNSIIATKYKNRYGVPALFSPDYFRELAMLHDDFGAKMIIENYKDRILAMKSAGKTADIDSPEDYVRLKNYNLKNES